MKPLTRTAFGSLITLACAALLLGVLSSCSSGGVPESSILIKNATTNALISTPNTTGSVDLAVSASLPLKIERTFKEGNGNTITSDVTAFSTYFFESGAAFASVDAFGNVTGVAPGTARLLVKFRASASDPFDTCRLDINVVP